MAMERRNTKFFGKESSPLATSRLEIPIPDLNPGPDIPSLPTSTTRIVSRPHPFSSQDSSQSAVTDSPILNRDPWQTYSKVLKVRLGGPVLLVSRKARQSQNGHGANEEEDVFTLRRLSSQDIERQLHMLTQIHHESILDVLEIYLHLGDYFVISPSTDVSLAEIIASTVVRASEGQIALIVYKV
jgi:hypothetical protein